MICLSRLFGIPGLRGLLFSRLLLLLFFLRRLMAGRYVRLDGLFTLLQF